MKASFVAVGKQIVSMAYANGVGRGSVYEFYWRGLEFHVHVITRRMARSPRKNDQKAKREAKT